MLKKLFKIGMLAGSLLVACTVNAQEYTPVYPQYSLGSNWSYGGKIIYDKQVVVIQAVKIFLLALGLTPQAVDDT